MRDGYGNFEAVKATMDDFGPGGKRLERDAIDPTDSIPFLDLMMNITSTGEKSTSTYQNEQNIYLYRPRVCATGQYPLYSHLRCYVQIPLVKYKDERLRGFVGKFLDRLTTTKRYRSLFQKAATELKKSTMLNPRPGEVPAKSQDQEKLLFIHLPYHPQQPSRKLIIDHGQFLLDTL